MTNPLIITRHSKIVETARTIQLSGMFDIPPSDQSLVQWQVDMLLHERDWNVGLIVGMSGAGKSTIARYTFGDAVVTGFGWPADKSVLDGFPKDMSVKDIVAHMTSVGFGSPPSWLRPYHVLSTGEQFRVTVARALAEMKSLAVIDEFTSVVDRQVAQIASYAIQKTVRRNNQRFVAVTCHYDVVEWLQPDWIYQPHANDFTWRSLRRRPDIQLEIYPVDRTAWRVFKRHHYMSADLNKNAVCFGAFINGECVAFNSYIHFPHPRNAKIKMNHRLVVLPDYQGLGIGGRFNDWLGQYLSEQGFQFHAVTAHPALIHYYKKSPHWRCIHFGRMPASGKNAKAELKEHTKNISTRRATASFVYKPCVS